MGVMRSEAIYSKIYSNQEVNLHCHSRYCGHGTGEIEDFALSAIKGGMKALGLSEHCPLPDDRYRDNTMEYAQLDSYIADCRASERLHRNEIEMFCGAECEWKPEFRGFYKDELLGEKGLDYAIMSVHHVTDENGCEQLVIYAHDNRPRLLFQYTDDYIKGLESGLFLFGCHPDLFGMMHDAWDDNARACAKAIIEAASELGIPLEVNGVGMARKIRRSMEPSCYPMERFWEMAVEHGVRAIVSSDSHSPEAVAGEGRKAAEAFAKGIGLKLVNVRIADGRLTLD